MNNKALVFGSFTEDKTGSRQPRPSSNKDKKPVQKKQLQFGSLNLSTGITFGDFTSKSSRQLGSTKDRKSVV